MFGVNGVGGVNGEFGGGDGCLDGGEIGGSVGCDGGVPD